MTRISLALILMGSAIYGDSGTNRYDPVCLEGLVVQRYRLSVTSRQLEAIQAQIAGRKITTRRPQTSTLNSALKEVLTRVGANSAQVDYFEHPTCPHAAFLLVYNERETAFLVEASDQISACQIADSPWQLVKKIYLSQKESTWLSKQWLRNSPSSFAQAERAELEGNVFRKIREAVGLAALTSHEIRNQLSVRARADRPWSFELKLAQNWGVLNMEAFTLPELLLGEGEYYGRWTKRIEVKPESDPFEKQRRHRQRDIAEILPYVPISRQAAIRLSPVVGQVALLNTLRLERAEIVQSLGISTTAAAQRQQKIVLMVEAAPELAGVVFSARDLKFYSIGDRTDVLAILIDFPAPILVLASIGETDHGPFLLSQDYQEIHSEIEWKDVSNTEPDSWGLPLKNAERQVLNALIAKSNGDLSLAIDFNRRDFALAAQLTVAGLRSTVKSLIEKQLLKREQVVLGNQGYTSYRLTEKYLEHFPADRQFSGVRTGPNGLRTKAASPRP